MTTNPLFVVIGTSDSIDRLSSLRTNLDEAGYAAKDISLINSDPSIAETVGDVSGIVQGTSTEQVVASLESMGFTEATTKALKLALGSNQSLVVITCDSEAICRAAKEMLHDSECTNIMEKSTKGNI